MFCLKENLLEGGSKSKQVERISNELHVDSHPLRGSTSQLRNNSSLKLATSNYFNELNTNAQKNKREDPNSFLVIACHSNNSMRLHSI